VCPYDTRVLPSSVVADAERTHPMLFGAAARRSSARYTEPEQFLASFPNLVAVPERPVDAVVAGPASLRSVRQRFEAMAAGTGLTASQVHELTVAISEVLTNALLHGGGRAEVRMWVADELVCVVDDCGEATADWMTGLHTPTLDADGGFGLWFARQVFDHVEIANSPEGGLRVVLSAELPGGADPTGL
jgi:anti-sigma regulatory factor (Ser/Thr protein kinase)